MYKTTKKGQFRHTINEEKERKLRKRERRDLRSGTNPNARSNTEIEAACTNPYSSLSSPYRHRNRGKVQ